MGFLDNYNALVNKPKIPGTDNFTDTFPTSFSTSKTTPQQGGLSFTEPVQQALTQTGTDIKRDPNILGEAVKNIPEQLSKQIGQPSLRAYFGLGSDIAKKLGISDTDYKPTSSFMKNLLGTSEPLSTRSVGEEVLPKGSAAAPALGLIFGIADAVPTGSQVRTSLKTLSRLAETAKREVVDSKTVFNLLNQPDVKQAEKDLIRSIVGDAEKINVKDLTEKVQTELLPLERAPQGNAYENIVLPDELRGPVADYSTHVYESPIKTSAGDVHFSQVGGENTQNYFAHTRIEDLPDNTTRRVIEAQSDLFQRGRLEQELPSNFGQSAGLDGSDRLTLQNTQRRISTIEGAENAAAYKDELGELYALEKRLIDKARTQLAKQTEARAAELTALQPYRNTWWERIIREEVRQAGIDGKTKLQFPTGETAMKIEGLGENATFFRATNKPGLEGMFDVPLKSEDLKVGEEVFGNGSNWIITDVLGDGKFKAVPKDKVTRENALNGLEDFKETFDISGKVDTENPIYRFYEKQVSKYLKNRYGAKQITDAQGVKWMEFEVPKEAGRAPVEAFGVGAGLQTDEEGNVSFSPEAAALGVVGAAGLRGTGAKLQKEALKELPAGMRAFRENIPQGASTFKKMWTNIVENVQNTEERIRQLVANKDLNTVVDPYEKLTLYHGRVGQKIEQGYQRTEEIAEDIVNFSGRSREATIDGRTEVNKYLQALHAPERNAALGDGAAGITTETAQQIVKDTPDEVKRIAEKVLELNRETLDMLKDSGVISEELHTTLRTKYKNHVPLQRIFEGEDDFGSILSGRGFDVRSTGVKSAKGSEREVADILSNVVHNYEQAVLRSEKNIVDNAALEFVRNNEEALKDVMTVRKPKVIGQTTDGAPLFERTNDPKILQFFENGKRTYIEFADENMAIAFRGVGKEKMPAILNWVGNFTRFYSGLATRFNPEFALPNKIRDLQETITYMASQKDIGAKGAFRTLTKDATSVKQIAKALLDPDSSDARLYNEMKNLGGTTGGMGLSTRKQTELNVDKIFNTARSNPRKAASKLIEYVDNWNTIFEDSTRLSVYKSALAQGATKERAAFLAKEASINFNRMGKGGPVINALYMFANASIQGSFKMIRALKDPKVAAGVAATMAGSVAAVNQWNNGVDPEWRDKVSKWDRLNGLPVVLPSEKGFNYMTIPVSWGLKPILVMTNTAFDAVDGIEQNATTIANDILSSIIDAYNPTGGTNLASAIMPTIGDVPLDLYANRSWSGYKIRPDRDQNLPADLQYFPSIKETQIGRSSVATSKALRETTGLLVSPADLKYVFEQYVGGAGRFTGKVFNTITGIGQGEIPPADEWPMVSRFLRQRTQEEVGQGSGGEVEKIKERLSDQARESFELKEEAIAQYETMKTLPQDVYRSRLRTLFRTNPDLGQKILDLREEEALGLTYKEKLIKGLQVGNGERAEYLATVFKELKTPEERRKLWADYTRKKIITDSVAEQLAPLIR